MNSRTIATIVGTAVIAIVGTHLFLGGRASAAPQGPTDLIVGPTYQVADFRACTVVGTGATATEWHFGGANRSLRNQLTPRLDGRGRRILRVVTNDSSLPAGHMRLRHVTESDPTLEGFTYGSYAWAGIMVEYNGRVEGQRNIGPCGQAR